MKTKTMLIKENKKYEINSVITSKGDGLNLKFENGNRLFSESEDDCCAHIYLSESSELKKLIGRFVSTIEYRTTDMNRPDKERDEDNYSEHDKIGFFVITGKDGEELFYEPFYESNNGYYSPSYDIYLVTPEDGNDE